MTDAINVPTQEQLREMFFGSIEGLRNLMGAVIVFHCEFSQSRGPSMYQAVRETDRMLNEARWPQLNLPEIYILEGGYSPFYEAYGEHAMHAGLIEVPRPDLNRSCRGYTKMKERPPESYWATLQK